MLETDPRGSEPRGPALSAPVRPYCALRGCLGICPLPLSFRIRGNGHKLEQRKLQLNPRKNFFPLRVTEPWPRLPREAVESPSLEIFQPWLDKVLCPLLWVTLLGQGVALGDPRGPCQPRPCWDSVAAPA